MPRCQWCRQESQDPNICDWCKRPLTAGWTPAVATAGVPADHMSFAKDDEPTSDRLLMFSVLGIVVLVAIAFGYSLLTRKQALPSVQPPTPVSQPVVQEPTPVADTQAPRPQAQTQPDPAPAPIQTQPMVEIPPVPAQSMPASPQPYIRATGNRKLDGLRDTVDLTN